MTLDCNITQTTPQVESSACHPVREPGATKHGRVGAEAGIVNNEKQNTNNVTKYSAYRGGNNRPVSFERAHGRT
jgi:hypothetical protein